eukprot:CAMPEP_0204358746 /NCGR_PEP_ID=MMETSP0469-20131031/36753_1 /ASSEMBLY_ACC=CAM_ASM_000384 /TAXON_ID=2969 /ORGANISM="Oxyrrhis marina" /LENGTH=198 /DNA_ID=CAMNT_0051346671 /DNA_START=13 /DNA_END=607 /DNA_ORIENTATION=-
MGAECPSVEVLNQQDVMIPSAPTEDFKPSLSELGFLSNASTCPGTPGSQPCQQVSFAIVDSVPVAVPDGGPERRDAEAGAPRGFPGSTTATCVDGGPEQEAAARAADLQPGGHPRTWAGVVAALHTGDSAGGSEQPAEEERGAARAPAGGRDAWSSLSGLVRSEVSGPLARSQSAALLRLGGGSQEGAVGAGERGGSE